jgi:hypothetical protein
MKKHILFYLISFSIYTSAQFNSSAPWMKNLGTKNGSATIEEMKNSFDLYWLTHDKNVRGSGYKPFMRWVNQWENLKNADGSLMTNRQLQQALDIKKQSLQSTNRMLLPTSNWQAVGPFAYTNTGSWSSGKGRVNVITIDPNHPNTIYMGTPASGIWKSTDSGINFTNISDQLEQNGVSGIAIDPNNSNIIYIATGDPDGGNTTSIGVYKSTDAGLNWQLTGLNGAVADYQKDIIINPTNSQMLWCATSQGIFKSADGGTSWTNTQAGDFSKGALRLKPNDPSVVYVSSEDGFYRSTNFGTSFSQITAGLPNTLGRTLIDVSPANPQIVYALIEGNSSALKLYKSEDSGLSFSYKSETNIGENSQTWYDMALAVSSTNADEVSTGTLNIWKSTNGGTLFEKLNNWSAPFTANYTHADIHFLKFFGNKLVCGSDGGIYVSSNQGASFSDLTTTAQIGQFYKVAVSKQSAGKMVGGLQDNGGFGYSNATWKNFYGADGMDTAIDPNNSNLYYGFIQNGGALYISNTAANNVGASVPSPPGEIGNWVTPLAVNSVGEVYSGFAYLFKLNGSAWVHQSTNAVGLNNIDELTIDPSNDNNMWAATDNKLYKSTDRGVHFMNTYTTANSIVSVCVNSNNSNIIYLVTNGTNGQALKSTDGGLTFATIGTGLPAIGKNCIKHQGRHTNNPLYLGTQLGVYYIDDTLSAWVPFDTNLPNIQITDLEINLEDAKIIAATFGRGIWQSDISTQIPLTDLKLTEINQPTSTVSCADTTPLITIKNIGLTQINSISINYTINTIPYSYNWIGVLNSMQTTIIALPAITLSRGSYTLKITATTLNDALADNNSLQTTFYINNSGTVGFVNNFETQASELITYSDGINDGWKRGLRSGSALDTGTNNVYSSNLTGNYTDGKKAYLVSQCYDLTTISNPEIRFKMAFDVETNYDIIYVQYSIDNGLNWTVLGTMGANWCNSNRTPINNSGNCQNCPGAQWTGTNTVLTEYFYPLNSLNSNNNIIFRIVFNTDDNLTGLGVVVDDFVINGTLATEEFDIKNAVIYPNPTNDIFNIGIGNSHLKTIEIIDVAGKIILKKVDFQENNSEISLNLQTFSNGVYFVKISTDESFIIKKIVKN